MHDLVIQHDEEVDKGSKYYLKNKLHRSVTTRYHNRHSGKKKITNISLWESVQISLIRVICKAILMEIG